MAPYPHFHLLPESASNISGRVDALFWFLFAVSCFITLLVLTLIVWFGIRYRRRTEDEVPPATAQHRTLEIGWTTATFAVMLVMFFWGTNLYIDMKRPVTGAIEIHVVGKQWMWKIQHPGGQREIDELHVPVGRPVKLVMTSQDVIHSFGIPAFRIKQDVLPDAYSTEWFTATKPGRYHLFCQEYCGTLHSGMIGWVIAMEPREYDAWLAGTTSGETPVVSGATLFRTYGCSQCHGQVAPTLAGLFGRKVRLQDGRTVTADENYIRESILNPPAQIVQGYGAVMPSYRGQLSAEQVNDLVAYIKSLGAARADEGAGPNAAAPATRPVNGESPNAVPNVPPARQPPTVDQPGYNDAGKSP
jgi:cytochrome c oxidase subunit 2